MGDSQIVFLFAVAAILAFLILIAAFGFVLLVRPWFRAFSHGTPVSMMHIVGMRLRGNPPTLLIDAYIALRRTGLAVTFRDVEIAYVDGRNSVVTSDDLVELVKTGAKGR